MPLNDTEYTPPTSRLETVMTEIGTALSPIVETVRYFLRLDVEEPDDKVVYIEPGVFECKNEVLSGEMRSYLPFRVSIHGYINETDTRILVNFIDEIIDTLQTASNISTFRTAFGSGQGFSIEGFESITPLFGEHFSRFSMTCVVMLHQED